MDAPMGSVGKDTLSAIEAGDIPGIAAVLIDNDYCRNEQFHAFTFSISLRKHVGQNPWETVTDSGTSVSPANAALLYSCDMFKGFAKT